MEISNRDRAGGGARGALAPPPPPTFEGEKIKIKKENKTAKNSRNISLVRYGQKLKLPLAK